MHKLLDGRAVAQAISDETRKQVDLMKRKHSKTPRLAIIRVGEDPADLAYERGAKKRCENLGIAVDVVALPPDTETDRVVAEIGMCNRNGDVDGILVFRPLPKHIDDAAVRNAVLPEKDIDGISDLSMAAVYAGTAGGFAPCTAEACIALLDHYRYKIEGKRAVVVGRSLVVGRPVALLLLHRHATVTVCHTRTKKLDAVCRKADILIAAAGSAGLIGKSCFNRHMVVVDAGINTDDDGNLLGDVVFPEAAEKVAAVTPVPGGVGSVTTSILARHVVAAAQKKVY